MRGLVGVMVIGGLTVDMVVAQFVNYTNLLTNLGVGHNFSCQPTINHVLQTADEYNKAGMNSATTLITLIPTLLTIGNLYVPRSSEAFGTSWIIGMLSAAFGLGLPVKSISAVPRTRTIDLRDLSTTDRSDIRRYGTAIQGTRRNLPSWEIAQSELHGWFLAHHGNDLGAKIVTRPQLFRQLKARTHRYTDRDHWWYFPAAVICSLQLFLFAAIGFSTGTVTMSQPLWSCDSEFNIIGTPQVGTTVWWLIASGIFAMVLRATQWSLSPHELVYARYLPQLNRFQGLVEDKHAMTTTQELPPLYHPFRPIESITQAFLLAYARVRYLSTYFSKSTFRRQRPLVVMVHLSLEARSPLITVLTGFIQALTLLVLTAFFGTYWGGTVIDTMKFMIILLVVVTMGRMLGLIHIQWCSRAFGFTVIECYHQDEVRGVLRLLASMPDVLIEINGAQYLWGTRVDGHQEFRRWLVSAEEGQVDQAETSLRAALFSPPGINTSLSDLGQEQQAVSHPPVGTVAPQPHMYPSLVALSQQKDKGSYRTLEPE